MKGSDLKKACDALAELSGDERAEDYWRMIGRIGAAATAATVPKIFSSLKNLTIEQDMAGGARLNIDAVKPGQMSTLLAVVGKASAANALDTCLDWSRAYDGVCLEALERAIIKRLSDALAAKRQPDVNMRLASAYAKRLDEALGDEAFTDVIREVNADPGVKAAEAKEIARLVTGRAGRGKKDSLDRVRSRHGALIDGRKRLEAIGGRSAA